MHFVDELSVDGPGVVRIDLEHGHLANWRAGDLVI
jgi:hypothetical protein